MKNQSYLKLIFIGIFVFFIIHSCKKDDDGYHQISALENNVGMKINEHRTNEGLSSLVSQYIMFEQAHYLSKKMANGVIEVGGTEINDKLAEITDNFGGDQSAWLAYTCAYADADSIFNVIYKDEPSLSLIEEQFTQLGVGVYTGSDNLSYVCLLFMNIP
jgi:hypothetical protein